MPLPGARPADYQASPGPFQGPRKVVVPCIRATVNENLFFRTLFASAVFRASSPYDFVQIDAELRSFVQWILPFCVSCQSLILAAKTTNMCRYIQPESTLLIQQRVLVMRNNHWQSFVRKGDCRLRCFLLSFKLIIPKKNARKGAYRHLEKFKIILKNLGINGAY